MLLIVKASDSTIWLSIQDPTTLAPAGLFRDPDPLRFNLHLELLSQVSNCGLHRCDLALHISTVDVPLAQLLCRQRLERLSRQGSQIPKQVLLRLHAAGRGGGLARGRRGESIGGGGTSPALARDLLHGPPHICI